MTQDRPDQGPPGLASLISELWRRGQKHVAGDNSCTPPLAIEPAVCGLAGELQKLWSTQHGGSCLPRPHNHPRPARDED